MFNLRKQHYSRMLPVSMAPLSQCRQELLDAWSFTKRAMFFSSLLFQCYPESVELQLNTPH